MIGRDISLPFAEERRRFISAECLESLSARQDRREIPANSTDLMGKRESGESTDLFHALDRLWQGEIVNAIDDAAIRTPRHRRLCTMSHILRPRQLRYPKITGYF